jgi:hypothetical protein
MMGPMPFDAVPLDEGDEFLAAAEERSMGPVERDLRAAGVRWWRLVLLESMRVWRGARLSLGLSEIPTVSEGSRYAPDIASEAIEHAEALGL